MDKGKLIDEIRCAFSEESQPNENNIIKHDCSECHVLKKDFAPYTWEAVPAEIIDDNFDNLPLFTKEAFHYFIPAYMKRVLELDDPYSLMPEFLIYNLYYRGEPQKIEEFNAKKKLFTMEQANLITSFLVYLLGDTRYGHHHDDIREAIKEWRRV